MTDIPDMSVIKDEETEDYDRLDASKEVERDLRKSLQSDATEKEGDEADAEMVIFSDQSLEEGNDAFTAQCEPLKDIIVNH